MKKLTIGFVLLLAGFAILPCSAVEIKGLFGVGGEFGGDKLLSLTYTDGSTSDILVGQGLLLFGGADVKDILKSGPLGLDLQATIGVKYSTIQEATNANANFYRFPAELLIFGRINNFRVGAGPVLHFANSFSGSGALSDYTFKFDNALGVTAQADYTWFEHYALGVRYTSIAYNPEIAGIGKLNASNFGFEFSYFF